MTIIVSGGGGREVLSAARTYYVRTDGSDSNNGLANTAGGAFLTIQKAVDTVCGLDCATFAVTIQVGSGTYTGAVSLGRVLGSGTMTLQGDTTTPTNVVISTTSSTAVTANECGKWTLTGFQVATTTSGDGISIVGDAYIVLQKVYYGAVVSRQVICQSNAACQFQNSYTISGAATHHMLATTGGQIDSFSGLTITISGTPAFSTAFASSTSLGGIKFNGQTFSGSATGTRYVANLNGVINTNGGGATYFPGDVAGSTATGGQYA